VLRGKTLAQTFAILWVLNRACGIQVAMFSMGVVVQAFRKTARKSSPSTLVEDDYESRQGNKFDETIYPIPIDNIAQPKFPSNSIIGTSNFCENNNLFIFILSAAYFLLSFITVERASVCAVE
jgi:hypothetical protein